MTKVIYAWKLDTNQLFDFDFTFCRNFCWNSFVKFNNKSVLITNSYEELTYQRHYAIFIVLNKKAYIN